MKQSVSPHSILTLAQRIRQKNESGGDHYCGSPFLTIDLQACRYLAWFTHALHWRNPRILCIWRKSYLALQVLTSRRCSRQQNNVLLHLLMRFHWVIRLV